MAQNAALSPAIRDHVRLVRPVASAVALGLLALLVAFVRSDHSSSYDTVNHDRSWLGYLPSDAPDGVSIGGLNTESSAAGQIRRIDLVQATQPQVVSMCFAASRQALRAGCPGFRFLGWTDRDVDYRAVGQLGEDSVDWLQALGSKTPRFEDLQYLDQ